MGGNGSKLGLAAAMESGALETVFFVNGLVSPLKARVERMTWKEQGELHRRVHNTWGHWDHGMVPTSCKRLEDNLERIINTSLLPPIRRDVLIAGVSKIG